MARALIGELADAEHLRLQRRAHRVQEIREWPVARPLPGCPARGTDPPQIVEVRLDRRGQLLVRPAHRVRCRRVRSDMQAPPPKPQLWRLDRVREARVLEETFERSPESDLRSYAERSLVTFQEGPVEVVLRYAAAGAYDAHNFLLHPLPINTVRQAIFLSLWAGRCRARLRAAPTRRARQSTGPAGSTRTWRS